MTDDCCFRKEQIIDRDAIERCNTGRDYRRFRLREHQRTSQDPPVPGTWDSAIIALREELRLQQKSLRTEKTYVHWARDFSRSLSAGMSRTAHTRPRSAGWCHDGPVGEMGQGRVTAAGPAPARARAPHRRRRRLFEEDRALDRPGVPLPASLARKYPKADTRWEVVLALSVGANLR